MKNIAKLIILVAIIFSFQWGCKENSITENNPAAEQISFNKPGKHDNNEQVKSEALYEMGESQKSQVIDGAKGGLITIHNIERKATRVIITTGVLFIPQGAFTGVKEIKISTNSDNASVQFYPPMKFDKPLILNLLFTGLTKADYDSLGLLGLGHIGFYYVPDQGPRELITSDGIIFKLVGGRLGVNNARLDHFSRYCWGK